MGLKIDSELSAIGEASDPARFVGRILVFFSSLEIVAASSDYERYGSMAEVRLLE